ncbi:MAG: hypothetical protein PG981_000907 [Wolbachia endosymbiont of Ctenocephalides orientis wCori]|nr:MAG: hypothetical protein PG981_000907 [Wolbachia endosymbiont of Ctenocephalides orientis wCori]
MRSLGLLGLVGDYNVELVYVLKRMLFQYHPDRNTHERAKEIFTLINENVYNPLFIILDDFEKYTNSSYTSCKLDEFLTWKIEKIKRIREEEEKNLYHRWKDRGKTALAVYNHLLSRYEPEGDIYVCSFLDYICEKRPRHRFTMKDYREEKADIFSERDKILI